MAHQLIKVDNQQYAVVDGRGLIRETRTYREHAAEVYLDLEFGLAPLSEDKQIRRDGLPIVLPHQSTTLVSERGRVPILEFSSTEQARLWLREYRRLCDRFREAINTSSHQLKLVMRLERVYRWAAFVDDTWEASFRNKVDAQRFLLERTGL